MSLHLTFCCLETHTHTHLQSSACGAVWTLSCLHQLDVGVISALNPLGFEYEYINHFIEYESFFTTEWTARNCIFCLPQGYDRSMKKSAPLSNLNGVVIRVSTFLCERYLGWFPCVTKSNVILWFKSPFFCWVHSQIYTHMPLPPPDLRPGQGGRGPFLCGMHVLPVSAQVPSGCSDFLLPVQSHAS